MAASLLTAACTKDPKGTATEGETASSSGSSGSSSATVEPTTGKPATEGTTVGLTTAEPTTGEPLTTSTTSEPVTTTEPATSTTSITSTTGGETTEGGVPMPVECAGKIYQCGNAVDDDMDGKIDGGDAECTSPCDDSEGSFQTNLPGQNKDCMSDCYWDGDSGQGNDSCIWNLQCDAQNPGEVIGCAYDPNKKDCDVMQADMCFQFCSMLAPNGCDCFGCCDVSTPNGVVQVYLGGNPECTLANLDACNSCTKQPGCSNDCNPDKCELCFGEEELPEGCMVPGCDNKEPCMVDKLGNSNCAEGFFCSTGCCQEIIPK